MPMQICPTTKAKLVSTMNLVNSRRPTYWSCGQSTGKSPRQAGCASGARPSGATVRCSASRGSNIAFLRGFLKQVQFHALTERRLVQGGQDVDALGRGLARRQDIDTGVDRLPAELKAVDRDGAWPQVFDLLAAAVEEGPARADGRAHRLLADGGAIVAHIALHHQ